MSPSSVQLRHYPIPPPSLLINNGTGHTRLMRACECLVLLGQYLLKNPRMIYNKFNYSNLINQPNVSGKQRSSKPHRRSLLFSRFSFIPNFLVHLRSLPTLTRLAIPGVFYSYIHLFVVLFRICDLGSSWVGFCDLGLYLFSMIFAMKFFCRFLIFLLFYC